MNGFKNSMLRKKLIHIRTQGIKILYIHILKEENSTIVSGCVHTSVAKYKKEKVNDKVHSG